MLNNKLDLKLYQYIQKFFVLLLQNPRPHLILLQLETTCIYNILQIICASQLLS